jgi:hypothetical protein
MMQTRVRSGATADPSMAACSAWLATAATVKGRASEFRNPNTLRPSSIRLIYGSFRKAISQSLATVCQCLIGTTSVVFHVDPVFTIHSTFSLI